MLSFLIAAACQQHYSESDLLKTPLSNGATIICEKRESKVVCVDLMLSNRDTIDTPATYGYRHLLEHIVASSIPGHDREIEKVGGVLLASTGRDWMQFEWRVPADQVALAFRGIDRMLRDCGATEDNIRRESLAIGHEIDLMNSSQLLSRQAWKSVYGEEGLDPLGTKDSASTAKPEDLAALWKKMTRGSNVVISACGNLDIRAFTTSCKAILSGLATSKATPFKTRAIDGSFGARGSVAVPIPPLAASSDAASAALVAAFGLTTRLNVPFITYTPSDRGGLAIVGTLDPFESVKDVLEKEDPAIIFSLGRIGALLWLDSKLSTPEGAAELNGQFLSLAPSFRPQKLADNIRYTDFLRNWNLMKEVAR